MGKNISKNGKHKKEKWESGKRQRRSRRYEAINITGIWELKNGGRRGKFVND